MFRMIRAIITDIGNVVLKVNDTLPAELLSRASGLEFKQVVDILNPFSEIVTKVQNGELPMREVFENHVGLLHEKVEFHQFTDAWSTMLGEDFPQVREAYESLKPEVLLYTLSNTNDLHACELHRHWLCKASRGFWLSCEVGMSKPDEKIFRWALEQMQLPGDEVVFFDDLEDNIVAAAQLGIRGYLVTDPDIVPQTLQELGLVRER
jgi:glucose-1-phosphatase